MTNPIATYSSTAKVLHWLMAAIIIVAWIIGFSNAELLVPKSEQQHYWREIHKAIGSSILLLIVLRIVWRLTHRPPSLPASMGLWTRRAATCGHWALYVLMILQPVTGWGISGSSGNNADFIGLFPLPDIFPKSKPMTILYAQTHTVFGWMLFVMIVGHIFMAFKHQFIDRDNLILRMLPKG